jgi:integrase/recombinase XerC
VLRYNECMKIRQRKGGEFELSFSLFGEDFKRTFVSFEDAYSFHENIKRSFAVSSVPMGKAVTKYRNEISVKKSVQSKTFDNYILENMLLFFEKNGLKLSSPTGLVDYVLIEAYQNYLLEKGYKSASVNRHFSTIKNFFKYCEKWEYVSKSPCRHLQSLSVRPEKKTLWDHSTYDFVRSHLNGNDQKLLDFLWFTGARVSSAVRLKVKDIDLSARQIGLSSRKGPRAKEKIYYFPIHTALKNFLKAHIKNKTHNDYAFLRQDGMPYNAKDYAKKINKVLRKSPQAINFGSKGLSTHGIRHSFASRMHQNGLTVNEVRTLLGHSTIRTTEAYLQSGMDQVLKKINKMWP